MDNHQVEFLAEDELINIRPRFTLKKTNAENTKDLELVCGRYGPFKAGEMVEVPLWVALYLKKSRRCNIIPPDWMRPDILEQAKQQEMDSKSFTEMPNPYFKNMVHLLLAYAPDDVSYGDEIKTLVKDIWDNRQAKLRTSIEQFVKAETAHAKLDYLTPLEISRVSPFLTGSLDMAHFLHTAKETMLRGGTSLSQSQSQ